VLGALALVAVGVACYLAVAGPSGSADGQLAGHHATTSVPLSTGAPTTPAAPGTTTITSSTATTAAATTATTAAAATAATTTTTTTAPPVGGGPPGVAGSLASTQGATQLITVVSDGYSSTYATLTAWARQGTCWVAVLGPYTARLGANGFSDDKHEGDLTTPTGAYSIGSTLFGNAPNPGTQYPYQQLVCGDWWDETPGSPTYNTFQYVPCGTTPPFGGGSEALWTETVAYSSLAVIDYNTDPVVPGAGSAVFLHATLGGASTGCVTIPVTDLHRVLDWLDPADRALIVLGPSSEVDGF
jgi:L,D-peptidoglycan transpeptidase YkuD (ErfK/YbiS/YcfS/YnhG family)